MSKLQVFRCQYEYISGTHRKLVIWSPLLITNSWWVLFHLSHFTRKSCTSFILYLSSLSHPQNEMSLTKRAGFDNLSIKPLRAYLGGMAELLQPFRALSPPSLIFPRSHIFQYMVKPTVEFCDKGRQHHCENQQIKLSGESMYSGSPHCIPDNEMYRHLINISV